jgi:hypothetical protein
VPLSSPQILHGLTWVWTNTSAVRCQKVARPLDIVFIQNVWKELVQNLECFSWHLKSGYFWIHAISSVVILLVLKYFFVLQFGGYCGGWLLAHIKGHWYLLMSCLCYSVKQFILVSFGNYCPMSSSLFRFRVLWQPCKCPGSNPVYEWVSDWHQEAQSTAQTFQGGV